MKVNIFMLVIALLTGALIFYGFYALATPLIFSLSGSILCTAFLVPAMSLSITDNPRSTVMFRTLAGILFVVLVIANVLFIQFRVPEAVFILTNGILAVTGATGLHTIYRSKQ